ncbi:MAG: hypothetical protein WB755_18450 [Terriglobales bacterium]
MGVPKDLRPAQLDHLRIFTLDLPEADRLVEVGSDASYEFSLPMRSNDVVLMTLEKIGQQRPPALDEGGR